MKSNRPAFNSFFALAIPFLSLGAATPASAAIASDCDTELLDTNDVIAPDMNFSEFQEVLDQTPDANHDGKIKICMKDFKVTNSDNSSGLVIRRNHTQLYSPGSVDSFGRPTTIGAGIIDAVTLAADPFAERTTLRIESRLSVMASGVAINNSNGRGRAILVSSGARLTTERMGFQLGVSGVGIHLDSAQLISGKSLEFSTPPSFYFPSCRTMACAPARGILADNSRISRLEDIHLGGFYFNSTLLELNSSRLSGVKNLHVSNTRGQLIKATNSTIARILDGSARLLGSYRPRNQYELDSAIPNYPLIELHNSRISRLENLFYLENFSDAIYADGSSRVSSMRKVNFTPITSGNYGLITASSPAKFVSIRDVCQGSTPLFNQINPMVSYFSATAGDFVFTSPTGCEKRLRIPR